MKLAPTITFFLFVLAISSCNKSNEKSTKINATSNAGFVTLEKIDSVQVEFLGIPTVHDLNPKTRDLIFMEQTESGEAIFVAEFDGKVKESFTKSGDFPDSYGKLLTSLKLTSDSTFLTYGSTGLLTFNLTGELKSKLKSSQPSVPSSQVVGMGFGLNQFEDMFLFSIRDIDRNIYQDLDKYGEVKNLKLIDAKTGKEESILELPNESLFLNGNYFFYNAWYPTITIKDDLLYVAFGIEPVIYIYSIKEDFRLINKIDLNLPDYRYFKGFKEFPKDLRVIGLRETSGRIKNIKIYKDYILVSYFPGYDYADTEERFVNKSNYEAVAFKKKMDKKYQDRLAVFNRSGDLINHFVPGDYGILGGSMLLRDGQLWVMGKTDPNVEKDYFKVFRIDFKGGK